MAALPLLAGLGGADYEQPAVFSLGFQVAMYVCAGGILAGSVLTLLTVRDDALRPTEARPVVPVPQRQIHCAVDGTPIDGRPAPVGS